MTALPTLIARSYIIVPVVFGIAALPVDLDAAAQVPQREASGAVPEGDRIADAGKLAKAFKGVTVDDVTANGA